MTKDVELMAPLGEWLAYEKEGLLLYITQFGETSKTPACRISLETSSTSTATYREISLEVASLKVIPLFFMMNRALTWFLKSLPAQQYAEMNECFK